MIDLAFQLITPKSNLLSLSNVRGAQEVSLISNKHKENMESGTSYIFWVF